MGFQRNAGKQFVPLSGRMSFSAASSSDRLFFLLFFFSSSSSRCCPSESSMRPCESLQGSSRCLRAFACLMKDARSFLSRGRGTARVSSSRVCTVPAQSFLRVWTPRAVKKIEEFHFPHAPQCLSSFFSFSCFSSSCLPSLLGRITGVARAFEYTPGSSFLQSVS